MYDHWATAVLPKLSAWGSPYLLVEDMDWRIDEAHTIFGKGGKGVDGERVYFLPWEELAGANADR